MPFSIITEITHEPLWFEYQGFLLSPFFKEAELWWRVRHMDGHQPTEEERLDLKPVLDFISIEVKGNA